MKVKRYDYKGQFGDELSSVLDDIAAMLISGHYVLSEEVTAFEQQFAEYLNASHVCGVNSGTDALVLALHALDIGPGDEVITQANTFHATVAAICHRGATPVLVDVDAESFLMNTAQVASAITPRTKAIIPVHLYGKPTPMAELFDLSAKHGISIIEDAAQAHGARLGMRRVGTIGHIGCFSFHPSKNLAAAGDAGALCTDDDVLHQRIVELRGLGQRGQNHHVRVGWNSKLDAIQARVLSAKLPHLDAWNQSRRDLASTYREGLANLDIAFQSVDEDEEHVYHLFQIRLRDRDRLLNYLQESGIDAVTRYPNAIHCQPAFADFGWKRGQFPVAEALADQLLCLPIRPGMPSAETHYVIERTRSFFGRQ